MGNKFLSNVQETASELGIPLDEAMVLEFAYLGAFAEIKGDSKTAAHMAIAGRHAAGNMSYADYVQCVKVIG